MIWEYGKGLLWGLRLWYKLWFSKTSIVTKFGLFFLLPSMPSGGFVVCMCLCVGRHINLLAIYIGRLFQVIQMQQVWVYGK